MFPFASAPTFVKLAPPRAANSTRPVRRVAFVDQSATEAPSPKRKARVTPLQSPIGGVPGFVTGTLMRVPGSEVPVEELAIGDAVMTRDHGAQIIRDINTLNLRTTSESAPVVIAAGALGNSCDLTISPAHQILLSGWRCTIIAGTSEVLTQAGHLVNGRDITRAPPGHATYVQLVFDRHEIITANGVATESIHPDAAALEKQHQSSRGGLFGRVTPKTQRSTDQSTTVRPEIKPYEARLIRP